MTDIVKKVTVEKFDDDGNLTERTITEYGVLPTWTTGIKVGDVWPYPNTSIVTYPNDGTYLVNSNRYDHGSFHSHPVGGTDRDLHGVVVD